MLHQSPSAAIRSFVKYRPHPTRESIHPEKGGPIPAKEAPIPQVGGGIPSGRAAVPEKE